MRDIYSEMLILADFWRILSTHPLNLNRKKKAEESCSRNQPWLVWVKFLLELKAPEDGLSISLLKFFLEHLKVRPENAPKQLF